MTLDKSNIGSLFNRIAGSYDGLNHFLSLGIDKRWRKKAVAGMAPSVEVLDVAIGTGDLAIELIRQQKAQKVTGIDLSEEMMKIGREKCDAAGLADRIEFKLESALEMPFTDCSFNAVTCSYGVRNFSDLDKGLAEMFRVLKPGGEVMILEFSYPKNKIISFFYDLYFSHILPFAGRLVSKDKTAYKYLNRSVKGFIWGEEFCTRLRSFGFDAVTFKPLSAGITTIYRGYKKQ